MTEEGFVREVDLRSVVVGADADVLLDALEQVEPRRPKWTRPPAP
jgi:hypothetical protein